MECFSPERGGSFPTSPIPCLTCSLSLRSESLLLGRKQHQPTGITYGLLLRDLGGGIISGLPLARWRQRARSINSTSGGPYEILFAFCCPLQLPCSPSGSPPLAVRSVAYGSKAHCLSFLLCWGRRNVLLLHLWCWHLAILWWKIVNTP